MYFITETYSNRQQEETYARSEKTYIKAPKHSSLKEGKWNEMAWQRQSLPAM